ncbi:lim and transglutaminase domain protein ltd-1-like isoform X2 [Mercenaria mercenaria]|uniref:lim and transglutaminase domain protein ltd-1-like isoform X2 n=1 Tax=Mercenaria mercenaria TaxID=6596 RepID=UPI00234E616C|nr:lim and transglutaminase domain protein ltd-1-like isoform X2 [Mercenaria mercenaria]
MGSGSSKPPAPTEPQEMKCEDPYDILDTPDAWELLTYLPPYGEDFEYSHTHFLYTNDLPQLEDVPPPHTSPTRKHEIFDPDDYVHVDERTDAVKDQALEKPLTELIRLLTGDYDDDISKVRALYRWFTSQPVETSDYKKNAKHNTAMFQLWNLKHKRNTYAGFFSLLCWYANLPCAIVRGYLKGSTYEVGQKINKDLHRGEWNAVLIDGNWRLVNAFWGACVLSGDEDEDAKQNYFYTCDENFFLTDPQQLIYTHFPEEPMWQLIDSKKTIKEFETMVFLKDRFFNLEMRVLSHPECNAEAKDGEIDILFGLHPEKSINHTFLCIPTHFIENAKQTRTKPVELPQKNVQLDFINRPNDNVLSVKVRFPKVGTYKLEIVGKDVSVTQIDYDFDWVAIYKVTVNSIPERQTFFPVIEAAGWGPGKILGEFGLQALSHLNGVIKMAPGPLEVKFKIIDHNKFKKANIVYQMLPLGEEEDVLAETHPFQQNGDILEAGFTVNEGEYKMKISHVFGEGHERNICNYHIISTFPPKPKTVEKDRTPTPEVDEEGELREKLREAIDSRNLEELERTVDLVESKGYAPKLGPELREAKDLIARLKRLQKLIHEVMTLNQRTIAEIKSYAHPPDEVHTVMRGTLLLLGNKEEETKDWRNVQALIGKTGKVSLKRRIQELDVNKLKEDTVSRTKALLKNINIEDIVIISAGAATFYSWSFGITEEFELRKKDT